MNTFLRMALCLLSSCLAFNLIARTDHTDDGHTYFNGIVTDVSDQPIKGVKIYTVSPDFATKSDKKGKFGLTDVRATDTLHLVYKKVNYDIPVQGRRSIRIRLADQLKPQYSEDEELVDIGYGWVRRREKITSSNGISGEVLVRTGKTNLIEALAGLVPGVFVTPSGQVGGDASIVIRGRNSLLLDCTPLFVVDGVVTSTLDFINLYDVESVEILKDASIYGSRGANGAILVHTKTGKSK